MIEIIPPFCLKEETVLEIGKFSVLWNAFEKEKCGTRCTEKKLIYVAQNYISDERWVNFACAMADRAKIQNCDSVEQYVNDKLSLGNGTQYKNKIIDFIKNRGQNNLDGGLLAIFRLRNNMFHGLKDCIDLDNQIRLFECMNDVLAHLL